MELNLLKLIFLLITFYTVFVGTIINKFSNYLPKFLLKTFLYGKFAVKEKTALPVIQVPKKWFQHFYIFASIWSILSLNLMIYVYVTAKKAPESVLNFLDFFGGAHREERVSASLSLLAMVLLTIQSWKRLYETVCISIFSNSKIDISHYLVGFAHYFGAILAILVEAKGFKYPLSGEDYLSFKGTDWKDISSTIVFLLASYKQLETAKILANLRKNKKGEVVSLKHKMPSGGLFKWVSSPHLMCEILMYTSLSVILYGNSTWIYVFFWVLSNQIETGLLSHWWYKNEFKDYPKNRYALFPYLL